MRYISTRDASISCTFEEAICSGYAPDGGLFVPENLPVIDASQLKEFSSLSFPELATEIMRMFILQEEIPDECLKDICKKSFVDAFDLQKGESIIPIVKVGNAHMVELFHGPTFCFKDFGMQAVIQILSFFSNKRKKKIKLVVSTTGDTGPACAFAVNAAANSNLNLLVHFPKDQISAFQRKQMTTLNSPYVQVASFEGGGDDMDLPIKNILKEKHNDFDFCGVNSYNIGRPLIQMIHFLWTYLRVAEQNQIELGDKDRPIDIIIPTGAMGNIAAAYMIKRCGLPIGKLCAGVNINDITDRVIQSGKFYKSERMEKTLSEAINIQVPYNFERLLYYLSDQNHNVVKSWMKKMDDTSKLDLDDIWLKCLQKDFSSAKVTDDEMCECIAKIRMEYNYFIDPHTAVALSAAEKLGYHLKGGSKHKNPFAIMSTASPCKFQESVTFAIGKEGWNEYQESHFPKRAKNIMVKPEINPTEYLLPNGFTIEEVQPLWEKQARNLMVTKY